MKKRTKPVFDGAEIFTSFPYLCAISAVTMYITCRSYMLVTTLIMSAVCCGMYMLFYLVRNRKLLTFTVFSLLLAAGAGIYALAVSVRGYNSVPDYIYGASETFDPLLALTVIMLFSFIAAYPTFYFSVKLPRPGFMLMPALAPLILGARTVGMLPGWLVALITASYFVAAMGVSHAKYPTEYVYVEDNAVRRERVVIMGVLGAAVAAAIFVIPRSDVTKYGRFLDRAYFYNSSLYGMQSMGGFTIGSSVNTGNNRPTKNLLFYAYTSSPQEIISQTFDTYNGKTGWSVINTYSTGYADWRRDQAYLNYNRLAYKLKNGVKEGKLKEFADELNALPDISEKDLGSESMVIRVMDNSNTAVVRHPAGTFNAEILGSKATIYRNEKDEMFTERPFGRNPSYTLYYYAPSADKSVARFFSGLSTERYTALLDAAADEEVIGLEEAVAFMTAQKVASGYYSLTFDESITPKLQELAANITAGLDNDYDKAMAIERWFGESGFIYDMNFVPQELTADYFIFTSKRGICSDFATASVLLLRAAGIPARYSEGFALSGEILNEYGQYAVTDEYAHAFASAFIPGSGWVNVDGTKYAALASDQKELQYRIFIIAAGASVLIVICVIFRKRLSELLFAIRWRFLGKNRIRALYLRTRKLACGITGASPASATTGEVRDIITRLLSLEKEASEITCAAEELFYGSGKTDADPKKLYRNYKLIRKYRRQYK